MPELTEEQKDLLVYLGGPDDTGTPVAVPLLNELMALGLINVRADGPIDLTDEGEKVYKALKRHRSRFLPR